MKEMNERMNEGIIYFGGEKIDTTYQYLPKYDKVAEMNEKNEKERTPLTVTFTQENGRMKEVKFEGNRIIPKDESKDYVPVQHPEDLWHRADAIFRKDGKCHIIRGLGGDLKKLEGKLRQHKRKLQYKEAFVQTQSRRRAALKGFRNVRRGKYGRFCKKE